MKLRVVFLSALFLLIGLMSHAQEGSPGYALLKDKGAEDQGISILWSTYNPDVFDNCILPYCNYVNENKCWKDVTLILWGPSIRLLMDNTNLQVNLAEQIAKGLNVKACRYTADKYKATMELSKIGVKLEDIYEDLTNELKGDVPHLVVF